MAMGVDCRPPCAQKVTSYLIWTALAASMGGLMFGYEIGISSGVTSMTPFLKEFFPDVYLKQAADTSNIQYCKFHSQRLKLFTSSLYITALLASVFGAAVISQKYGCRTSMMLSGCIFMIGASLNAAAINITMLIVGRILLGIGIGFSNQSVLVYLLEMAPYNYRGRFNFMFQFMITLGILSAHIISYNAAIGWRLLLGFAGLPAALMFFSLCFLSDTPNSLVVRGKEEEAKAVLKCIRGVDNVEAELKDMVAAKDEVELVKNPWWDLLNKRCYRPQLCMSVLVPFFQQFSGINLLMLNAPLLFKGFGLDESLVMSSLLLLGTMIMLGSLTLFCLVDRLGRRYLMLHRGVQMLGFQALAILVSMIPWEGMGVVLFFPCVCMYVEAFSCSWGPLGWLYPIEILPVEVRSQGMSLMVAANMMFTFVVGECFLTLFCIIKYMIFELFAIFTLVMIFYCYYLMPETNIPIEDMNQLWKRHWFWKRFINDTTDPLNIDVSC